MRGKHNDQHNAQPPASGGRKGERHEFSLKKYCIVTALAVMLAAGAMMFAFGDERSEDTDTTMGGMVPSPWGDAVLSCGLNTPGASGEFTMMPGHLYKIEITSGAGGNSANGAPGGQGAIMTAWFDARDAAGPAVYSYSILTGGQIGLPSVGGHYGGAGGYAVFVTDDNGDVMIVAGGGGGGPANGGGGGDTAAPGANAANGTGNALGGKGATPAAGGLGGTGTVTGGTGGGIGSGKGGDGGSGAGYGGGGGGSGYTGGGGGAGSAIGAAGGGGGGTSYIDDSFSLQSFVLGRGPFPVKVTEYVAHGDVTISASGKTAAYDGAQHGIDVPTAFPASLGSSLTVTYTGNGHNSTVPPITAGEYTVTITTDPSVCEIDPVITTLRITPVLIPRPYAPDASFVCTGSEQTLDLCGFDDAVMTVTGNTGTDAGAYIAAVSLKDPVNNCWDDGAGNGDGIADVTIGWSITYLKVAIQASDMTVTYDGERHGIDTPTIFPVCAECDLVITYTGNGYSGTAPPVCAGVYDVVITIESNICEACPAAVTLTICPVLLQKPTAGSAQTEYTGDELFLILVGFDGSKMSADGIKATAAGTHNAIVSLSDPVNYHWDDGLGNDDGNADVNILWIIFALQADTKEADEGAGKGSIPAFAVSMLAVLLLMFAAWRTRARITGIVLCDGIAAADAVITYTADGKEGTVTTDLSGAYVISVRTGADVIITAVSKDGPAAWDVRISVKAGTGTTELDIAVSKKG
ncbi:MAG: hypothetical protein LBH69_01430 [Methanomassiliicoccaceae archaeon]|jgi:hypothetical protein|nr:hypothetical protein [Methanomassiliicoccaceae archaeon]